MNRFSDTLRDRFDIVSFDPRGVGRSNPILCSDDLMARKPSPAIKSQAEFDATVAYNDRLRADCRKHTGGPGSVFDHVDTLSTVKDLEAIRKALGESTLTFHGSSYGTLLGEQYAERYPRRVRAMVLESVMDHSLRTSDFLTSQASTAEDSFAEFAAWCERDENCALHGRDVRRVWAGLRERAERGELTDPSNPQKTLNTFELSEKAIKAFYGPRWTTFAKDLVAMATGAGAGRRTATPPSVTEKRPIDTQPRTKQPAQTRPAPARPTQARPVPDSPARTTPLVTPNPTELFCQDWDLPIPDYRAYARELRRMERQAPTMRHPRSLGPVMTCLGAPERVTNPQHRLKVRGSRPILLTNSRHDPATSHTWAAHVARQLGGQGVLLTYEGWGHGTYMKSRCVRDTVDRYLISLAVPARGTTCPAEAPAD
ncbi:alpha/beta fold hydrolase [Streptomyces sp. NPDC003077]|uniref:alpha/beta fold hydrolase n=1 Tax=Streptomyces sp. NPDC003077 TaxID=3154443 RepID=UPI0033A6C095